MGRGVGRRGTGGGGEVLKPPLKNLLLTLLLTNEKLNFETPSELRIPCVKSREFYSVT